eukprot:365091-Chlamydomonas_euryale.AAC.11
MAPLLFDMLLHLLPSGGLCAHLHWDLDGVDLAETGSSPHEVRRWPGDMRAGAAFACGPCALSVGR